jgi:hypothetical protein
MPSIAVQVPYRMVLRATADDQDCIGGGASLDGSEQSYDGNRIGFRARNVSAVYNYVAVYRVP